MYGTQVERWTLSDTFGKAAPLIENRQKPNQQASSSAAGGSRPPATKAPSPGQNKSTDFAQLLKKLKGIKLQDGSYYKPRDVAALKASFSDTAANPDAEKLKLFLKEHGLCFICRGEGHSSHTCPENRRYAAGAARK